jgi:polysaccharide pyruvyl transferase WcaK-like protein
MSLMRASADLSPRIALLSPCGWNDLGNFAIVDSLINGIRERIPRARIVAFTMNPDDTVARHSIEAHTLASFSLPFYPVREPHGTARTDAAAPEKRTSARGAVSALASWVRRLPVQGPLRTWLLAPLRFTREPGHFALSRERLRGAGALVVAGGGQLDAAWGGILGHPYVLWRWGRIARSVGAAFVFASVGTGSLTSPSRRLILRALALASYRSYRDDRSRELLGPAPALAGDPTVPDLAYALPVARTTRPRSDRLTIGLSPMNYRLPGRWPKPDMRRYRAHIQSFADIAARALRDGHEVVLFATDDDGPAVDDTATAIAKLAPTGMRGLRIAPTPSVAALLSTIAGVDLVVTARLHGVILSHVSHRPVLAVAHERKVRTLMEEAGQARFCFDIASVDPAAAYARLLDLAAGREELTRSIADAVERNRVRVSAQYDALFGPIAS